MLTCTRCRDSIDSDRAGDAVLGAVVRRDGAGREIPDRSRLLGAFHGQCWAQYRAEYSDGIEVESCPDCSGRGMVVDKTLDETPEHATPWMLDCQHCSGRGWLEVSS